MTPYGALKSNAGKKNYSSFGKDTKSFQSHYDFEMIK